MGQFCTRPGFLFVPAGDWNTVADAIGEALVSSVGSEVSGHGLHQSFEDSLNPRAAGDGVGAVMKGRDLKALDPSVLGATSDAVRNNLAILHREMLDLASMDIQYQLEDALHAIAKDLGISSSGCVVGWREFGNCGVWPFKSSGAGPWDSAEFARIE